MLTSDDLGYLKRGFLSGVLVGRGSMILHLGDHSSISVHCPFEVVTAATRACGHGETPASAVILFDLLNEDVIDARDDPEGRLMLEFANGSTLRILPEHTGFEEYVVDTPLGVSPVVMMHRPSDDDSAPRANETRR